MAIARKGIAEILLEKKLITPEQLVQARDVQKSAPGDLGRILVDLGFATDRDVVQSKAEAEGIPFIDLIKYQPESSAVNVVPQNIVQKYNALPVRKDGPNLFVAMADPRNVVAVDDIRMVARCTVRPMMAVPSDLEDAIAKVYAGSGGSGVTAVAPMGGGAAVTSASSDLANAIKEYGGPANAAADDDNGPDGSENSAPSCAWQTP
jgi:type IV pilus assembly protein PilB